MASNVKSRLASWSDFWSCSPHSTSGCEGGTSLRAQSGLHAQVLSLRECPPLRNQRSLECSPAIPQAASAAAPPALLATELLSHLSLSGEVGCSLQTNAVFSCGCWLVCCSLSLLSAVFTAHPVLAVRDSRDLFDSCAGGLTRLRGCFSVTALNCLVWGF